RADTAARSPSAPYLKTGWSIRVQSAIAASAWIAHPIVIHSFENCIGTAIVTNPNAAAENATIVLVRSGSAAARARWDRTAAPTPSIARPRGSRPIARSPNAASKSLHAAGNQTGAARAEPSQA